MAPQTNARLDASQSGGAVSVEANPDALQAPTTAVLTIDHSSFREEADDYAAVFVRIGTDLRVVACRQRLQWIVQRRRASAKARVKGRWTALGFCASRQGLIRVSRAFSASDGLALRAWAVKQQPHFRSS